MNERIKKLMDYAVRFRLDPDSNVYEAQVQPEDLELFAELIVRECANVAADHEALDIYEEIRDHFGVEQDSEEDSNETCPRCGVEWSGTSCGLPECGWVVGVEE
jgi:hypothetical protein